MISRSPVSYPLARTEAAMRVLNAIAVALLVVSALGCGASHANSSSTGATKLGTAKQDVPPCHGDPPTLPCHHVDVGR
jgi:hypothetical protein